MTVVGHGELRRVSYGQTLVLWRHPPGVRLELSEGVTNVEVGAVEEY